MPDRSRSPRRTSIYSEGYLYATLDSISPYANETGRDKGSRKLPEGWEIAPEEKDITSNVIGNYSWGAKVLIVGSGVGFGTKLNDTCVGEVPGALAGKNLLKISGGKYAVASNNQAHCRILIRQRAHRRQQPSLGSQLWQNREFTDCTIRCQSKEISCHRAVLAASSPVFQRMLSSNMREATENSISIVDSSPSAVEAMVGFAYIGREALAGSLLSIDDWQMILGLADKYQMPELMCVSAAALCREVDESNVVKAIRALRIFSDRPEVSPEWIALDALVRDRSDLRAVVLRDL